MKTELKNDRPNVKRADSAELFPAYLAAMEEAGSVVIPVSGTSMNPFLRHLSDTVTLEPARGKKLKKGDIVLYERSGIGLTAYVMHRIVGKKDGAFVLCGDARTLLEYGVKPESVVAVVTKVCRRGKTIGPGSPVWFFYSHIWRVLRPIRPALLRVFAR